MTAIPIIGATLSHPHLHHLGIPLSKALQEYNALGLSWIRLGSYWSEIEKKEGTYEYRVLREILGICTNLNLNVVMTVGMKAPRWPEYYLPSHLEKKLDLQKYAVLGADTTGITRPLFKYIRRSVSALKTFPCIKYWQVENEPLDPSGPMQMSISRHLLEQEIHLVRTLDMTRPVTINLWGNELSSRGHFDFAARLSDAVGIDIYPRVPIGKMWKWDLYIGPRDGDIAIMRMISSVREKGRMAWISELQAEPWSKPESCTPAHIIGNTRRIINWGLDAVFFWGFEYWLLQKLKGNASYWSAAGQAIRILRGQ